MAITYEHYNNDGTYRGVLVYFANRLGTVLLQH